MKAKWTKWGVCALAVVALAGCATGGGGGLSDEELIKNIVTDAMAALAAGDIDAMVANYADDMSSDQGGKAEIMEFLQGAKDQGMLDGITANLDDLVITIDGDKATAEPIALDTAMGGVNLSFELEKRDGVWLVTYQGQG